MHYRVVPGLSKRVRAMKEADEEERVLRRYLLGELNEDEQERVEVRFITDLDFKQRALIVEDELVEDYLSGELSDAEKALFTGHFLATPEQRQKLKIAGSVRRYLIVEKSPPPLEPDGEVLPLRARESGMKNRPFWRKPLILVPASLMILLVLVFGLLRLTGVQQRRNQLAEIRLELEQLNRQPGSAASSSIFLTPLATRGAGDSNSLSRPADGAVVQLWLMLIKDEYRSYQAVFRKEGDTEQFPLDGLRAETTVQGKAVPVRLLSKLLSPGVYIVKLNGIADGGRAEEIGEYIFQVTP